MSDQTKLTRVISSKAPPAGGHYEQGILYGDTLYVSGQLGVLKGTLSPESVAITEQVAFALGNIEAIASTVGSSRSDVIKATIFVTDITHWDEVNRAYAGFFGDHKPARSVVPCKELHFGAKVEIEAVVAVR